MKKIPIQLAKSIAKIHHYDGVIVIAVDMKEGEYCITSYGQSAKKCAAMNVTAGQIEREIQTRNITIPAE